MSEFSEPKKETVRIAVPPPLRSKPAAGEGGGHGTVRINLPEAAAAAATVEPPAVRPPVRPPLRPPAPAPNASLGNAAAAPAPENRTLPPLPPRPRVLPPPPRVQAVAPPPAATGYSSSGSVSGPKKETARISMLPEPVPPPGRTVKMKKTQPLLTVPPEQPPVARVQTAPPPAPSIFESADSIPMPLVWAAFGVSLITLLIQIWNYFGF